MSEWIKNLSKGLKKKRNRYISNDIIAEVMRRCEGKCFWCKATENLQLGHIIPFSKGGSNSTANLIVECEICNKKKGTEFIPTTFLKLEEFIKPNQKELDINMGNKPTWYQQAKWWEARIKFLGRREIRLEQKLKRLERKIYGGEKN